MRSERYELVDRYRRVDPDGVALTGGGRSGTFFELREAVGNVWDLKDLADAVWSRAKDAFTEASKPYSVTAHTGMLPLATAFALHAYSRDPWPDGVMVYDDRSGTYRGRQACRSGRVLIVTDVVTTGNTVIEQARRLRKLGYEVIGVVAVVDGRPERTERIDCEGFTVRIASCFARTDFI